MCALQIYMVVRHLRVACGHGGLQSERRWMGFPACVFHRGILNARFHLAELFH